MYASLLLADGKLAVVAAPTRYDYEAKKELFDNSLQIVDIEASPPVLLGKVDVGGGDAEAGDEHAAEGRAVRARLLLMGRRLYRFGHIMFGIAAGFGLVLWLGHFVFPHSLPAVAGIAGGWLHAKLAFVGLLLAHFIVAGRWLKGVDKGRALPSATTLRWFNEIPVVLLVVVVYLVLAKPF